ncbi:response regulator [Flaviaesturariibacter flavus]|uniref:Response regulator n=1 Tax=Flaviaesturariibacter flavus TaxID=2502780 RepID=A0A4R1B776_9BACT|nr:response regulator [Flaviaesturariibacter flavus]TCJ12025.1 response regulator [Flaviaesturariibacter flavus]
MQKLAYRILLVEDDADDRYIMHQAFSELRFNNEVKMFSSGQELLEYLEHLPAQSFPELFVLDYNMPAINGAELALFLRQQACYSDIPVVLYSTGMSPKLQRELLQAGVQRCYEKGMEYSEVLDLARTLVDLISKTNHTKATHGIRFESLSES